MTQRKASNGFPAWDHKLPKTMLNDYDTRVIVHGVSRYLHNITETKHCTSGDLCMMCGGAVRLVTEAVEPKLIEKFIEKTNHALRPHQTIDLHPRVADDFG